MTGLKFMSPEGKSKSQALTKPEKVPEVVDKSPKYSPDPRGGSYHQAVSRHRLLSTIFTEP